jgi:protease I
MANMQKPLDGMKVAILVSDDFEQVEMTEPRKALKDAGAETFLISTKTGQVHGMKHDVKVDAFPVDMSFSQADPDQFDAVLLPGGAINADHLRIEPQAQKFIQKIQQEEKPIAVICHAPWLLVSANLMKGRKITSYPTIQDDIRNAGGQWTDQESVRDRNWISSRSPKDIPAFNKGMIELFQEKVKDKSGQKVTHR